MRGLRAVSLLICAFCAGPVMAQGITLPDVGRLEFENGVVVILLEKEDVPLIGVEAIIKGGAISDPVGLDGMANLLAGILTKGAGERSAAEFADAIDSAGGQLSAVADSESINISAEFMARDADLMIELLADMLRRPTLDAEEIRKLRDRSIDEIRADKDGNASALRATYGSAFLFGEHPYARPLGGSEESLANVTVEDVREYYANLECDYGADMDTVKESYRRLMRKYHPDKFANDPEMEALATNLSQELTRAYQAVESYWKTGRY